MILVLEGILSGIKEIFLLFFVFICAVLLIVNFAYKQLSPSCSQIFGNRRETIAEKSLVVKASYCILKIGVSESLIGN